jgi:hypothetical protein
MTSSWHVGLAAGGGDVRHESLGDALRDAVTSSLAFDGVVAVRDQDGTVRYLAHQGQIFRPMSALELCGAPPYDEDGYTGFQGGMGRSRWAMYQAERRALAAWNAGLPIRPSENEQLD